MTKIDDIRKAEANMYAKRHCDIRPMMALAIAAWAFVAGFVATVIWAFSG